jgi:cyclophilin family peptidyl-prolyl cis-trans isomerase/HEAT repeat protein
MNLLRIEFDRNGSDPRLLTYLMVKDSRVVAAAVKSAGRIGAGYPLSSEIVAKLNTLVNHPNAEVRAEAAYTLGAYRLNSAEIKESSRNAISKAFAVEKSPVAASRQAIALGSIGNSADLAVLFDTAKKTKISLLKNAALMGIYAYAWDAMGAKRSFSADDSLVSSLCGELLRTDSPSTEIAAEAIYAMAGADPGISKRPIILEMIKAATAAKLDRARSWLLLSISSKDPRSASAFQAAARDPSMAVRSTYAAFVGPYLADHAAAIDTISTLLRDSSPVVAFAASMGLGTIAKNADGKIAMQPKFDAIASLMSEIQSSSVRSNLLSLLVALDSAKAEPFIRRELGSRDSYVRAEAISDLPGYFVESDRPILKNAIEGNDPYLAFAALQAVAKNGESKIDDSLRVAIEVRVASAAPEALLSLGTFSKWKSMAGLSESLAHAYPNVKQKRSSQHLTAILDALANIGSASGLDVVNDALHSVDPRIVTAAKSAYEKITGKPSTVAVPVIIPVSMTFPTFAEIQKAINGEFKVSTTKGTFRGKMNPNTPFADVAFFRLTHRKAYNGSLTNGIWPSYLVSFGDTSNGTGTGFPLATFRDELVTPFEHARGALYFAGGDGPDAYSGDFYADLTYRFYDARTINTQTSFARVISGMSVLDHLEVFDRIQNIEFR